jgi:hypothetical protein
MEVLAGRFGETSWSGSCGAIEVICNSRLHRAWAPALRAFSKSSIPTPDLYWTRDAMDYRLSGPARGLHGVCTWPAKKFQDYTGRWTDRL